MHNTDAQGIVSLFQKNSLLDSYLSGFQGGVGANYFSTPCSLQLTDAPPAFIYLYLPQEKTLLVIDLSKSYTITHTYAPFCVV